MTGGTLLHTPLCAAAFGRGILPLQNAAYLLLRKGFRES
jgi:hypothetical protein